MKIDHTKANKTQSAGFVVPTAAPVDMTPGAAEAPRKRRTDISRVIVRERGYTKSQIRKLNESMKYQGSWDF
jgi:hypothetical protein